MSDNTFSDCIKKAMSWLMSACPIIKINNKDINFFDKVVNFYLFCIFDYVGKKAIPKDSVLRLFNQVNPKESILLRIHQVYTGDITSCFENSSIHFPKMTPKQSSSIIIQNHIPLKGVFALAIVRPLITNARITFDGGKKYNKGMWIFNKCNNVWIRLTSKEYNMLLTGFENKTKWLVKYFDDMCKV